MIRTLFLLAMIAACSVRAQIVLPKAQSLPVPLPRVGVNLPGAVDKTVSDVAGVLDGQGLVDLRALRIRALTREHREVIDTDPRGAPVVRAEVLALSPSDAALEHARAAGFSIARDETLEGLDSRIVVLRAPQGLSTRQALKRLRKIDPQGSYDFNHIYTNSGVASSGEPNSVTNRSGVNRLALADEIGPKSRVKVGLIDGGVDTRHPVFQGATIHTYGCGAKPGSDKPIASPHGTAVASLLAGNAGSFHGAAPGAELFAADVYCGAPTGGAVDALARALAWMAREKVPVINVSLVGPPNIMLETVLRATIAKGHIIVAAVGNDGPAARPLYPAAYPDVIGVTGVDARRKVIIEALRGPQVDFAAPGADMLAAGAGQTYVSVRGTSFAAPLVAGLLAIVLPVPDKSDAEKAGALLAGTAIDLGVSGPDRIYGNGLIGESLRIKR